MPAKCRSSEHRIQSGSVDQKQPEIRGHGNPGTGNPGTDGTYSHLSSQCRKTFCLSPHVFSRSLCALVLRKKRASLADLMKLDVATGERSRSVVPVRQHD